MAQGHSRFHGKDPRYKNRERTTLADITPAETRGWESEAKQFLSDRQMDDWKANRPVGGRRRDLFKVAPNPELEEVVKSYLATRDAALPPKRTNLDAHNDEILLAPERVKLDVPLYVVEPGQSAPTSRDILLQMFASKRIGQGYFHAGRRWQWDREASTLQPSVSIDWSRESPSQYQSEELSERQWEAIRRRKQFIRHAGLAAATMLDFLLDADRGRAELMQLTQMPVVQIECALEELLGKVCECYAP